MTTLGYTVKFKRTVLATIISLSISQGCFALEELQDEALSESTGEGIALLPENFSMRFNGVSETGVGADGGGSIRLIPVGPTSAVMAGKGYQKADIFVNGISLAQSKKDVGVARTADDWGTPFGGIGTAASDFGRQITSWGTTDNPWILKTLTDPTVPDFAGVTKEVTYLNFEAPLMNKVIPTTGAEASAYNLKLGFYADAFMRDQTQAESITNRMQGLSNRIRLAAVWDGFSINGSNIKLFRTLGGVPLDGNTLTNGRKTWGTYTASPKINGTQTPTTFNFGTRPSYNETLGIAGVIRLNSGEKPKAFGAAVDTSIYVQGGITRKINVLNYTGRDVAGNPTYSVGADVTNASNGTEGIYTTYTPPVNGSGEYQGTFTSGGACTTQMGDGSGGNSGGTGQVGQCLTQEGVTVRRFAVEALNDWVAPVAKSVFRISTQELTGTDATGTPAFGGLVPSFSKSTTEGVFLYNPNINLVLGSLQQPLVFNAEKSTNGSGSNFSMELTRIPDNQNVYKNIYQRYEEIDPAASVDVGVVYKGTTCTILKCGGETTINGVVYQDSKATHSSITIGTSQLDANGRLVAYKGIDAYGISFGSLQTVSGIASSATMDYTKVWQRTRGVTRDCTWTVGGSCWSWGSYYWGDYGNWSASPIKNPITATSPQATHPSQVNLDPYETTFRQNTNGQIYGIQTTLPTTDASSTTLLNSMQPKGGSPMNNMGSAVIDGLLIQHLKFSTTGL